MADAAAYEAQRRRQIEENKRRIEELGLRQLAAAAMPPEVRTGFSVEVLHCIAPEETYSFLTPQSILRVFAGEAAEAQGADARGHRRRLHGCPASEVRPRRMVEYWARSISSACRSRRRPSPRR